MTDELVAAWVGTMAGSEGPGGFTVAHRGGLSAVGTRLVDRAEREQLEASLLAPGATRATGAGNRARLEEPDDLRTCFERDRDRIVHSRAFRRLAGKTQVFVYPADHQRTRLTHALEVAQVAAAVARATSLSVALTEAIALGHDCGHGPGGHASEGVFADALGSFHHASFGADITLAPLNLCRETLDGIRCHSWSQPAPATPEGAVVSWADRIAYCAHDLEDAERAGIVSAEELPAVVRDAAGSRRSGQLRFFIDALIAGIEKSGVVAMGRGPAEVLGALREFNYERIYQRPASVAQGAAVAEVLSALVGYFIAHPGAVPLPPDRDEDDAARAVRYVDGMTDRFCFEAAVELLGFPRQRLPVGIDVVPGTA